jgi:hypothetical protein
MIEPVEQMDADGVKFIHLEPDWKNFPTWHYCIQQMIEGHSKHTKQMTKICEKKGIYRERFEFCKHFANEEIKFWTAIKELACKEVYEMQAAQEKGELDD